MKEIIPISIAVVCIIATFGITYVTVNAMKENEILENSIEYENQISVLNYQLNKLNKQVDNLSDEIDMLNAQIDLLKETGGSITTPEVIFIQNDATDELTVLSVNPAGLTWDDFLITGLYYTLGSVTLGSGPVIAGQALNDCSGEITIEYIPTNTLIGIWTFT